MTHRIQPLVFADYWTGEANDMFVTYTWQDWLDAQDKVQFIETVIATYKASREFKHALDAKAYFEGNNTNVLGKYIVKADVQTSVDSRGKRTRSNRRVQVEGNRLPCGFFRRAVLQENQYILSNGVTLDDPETKAKLGMGFDKALEFAGEYALVQGVSYLFWNSDHVEVIPAATDKASGFVCLLDEMTSEPRIGIQFWQISAFKPMYVRLFETDGVTIYIRDNKQMRIAQEKRSYVQTVLHDSLGEQIIAGENYSALPVIPLFANNEKTSELTPSIKRKIDAYDNISSDFADNLDRANDVYWVLNNFGGSIQQALEIMQQINELKIVANQSDGSGSGASAEPRTIEVPYNARQTALEILRKEMYLDYMALDMDALTGGSLTNVAIRAAMANLDLKADIYEWQCFQCVQKILRIVGIDTENITFRRQTISNDLETVQAIYMMRSDIDLRTALELNPFINADDIDTIMANISAETKSGLPSMDELKQYLEEQSQQVGEDE